MAPQYDEIGVSFDQMQGLPTARLVAHNFQKTVSPLVPGAKVLDLACGTGRFSNAMMSWGASEVVGVDVSISMVEAARAKATSEKLQFIVGDCSKPMVFGSGEYDLVTGAWLLNYASNKEEMTDMYRTIAMNLKDGGIFVGVTPHPTEDPRTHTEKESGVRPVEVGNCAMLPKGDVADGLVIHLVSLFESGNIEFDGYHLRRSIYETAARDAGLNGRLIWEPVDVPDGGVENSLGLYDAEYWQTHLTVPHFGILLISKS